MKTSWRIPRPLWANNDDQASTCNVPEELAIRRRNHESLALRPDFDATYGLSTPESEELAAFGRLAFA